MWICSKKTSISISIFISIILAILLIGLAILFFYKNQPKSYLLKPTGNYGIGYHDVYLINTDICPDVFYRKNKNEKDFSPTNKRFCHEILLRIYYPSQKSLGLGNKYYQSVLTEDVNFFLTHYKLSAAQISAVKSIIDIRTYTHLNAKPAKNKHFPVLLFLPGAGQPAQTYTNIISELVSHGYVVIGVNSLFLNGSLQLQNGRIVKNADSGVNKDIIGRTVNLKDLEYLLKHIKEVNYPSQLRQMMNFHLMGLVGHSRNGISIINLLKKPQWDKNTYLKLAVVMDPGDLLGQKNYPLPKAVIPTLVIWSSHFKYYMHGSVSNSKNSYEVILKDRPKNHNYTNHENFSDLATLQYHPGYNISEVQKKIHNPKYAFVGAANGCKITRKINRLILKFCDRFLKPEGNF